MNSAKKAANKHVGKSLSDAFDSRLAYDILDTKIWQDHIWQELVEVEGGSAIYETTLLPWLGH